MSKGLGRDPKREELGKGKRQHSSLFLSSQEDSEGPREACGFPSLDADIMIGTEALDLTVALGCMPYIQSLLPTLFRVQTLPAQDYFFVLFYRIFVVLGIDPRVFAHA